MPVTHTKRAEDMHADETAGIIPADRSETVHELPGGWRIARLTCAGDARRESWLMRNCVAGYVGDQVNSEVRERVAYRASDRPDDDPLIPATRNTVLGMHLHSLRNEANVPFLSFWASDGVHDVGAYRNAKKIQDKYLALLDSWIEHDGLAARGTPRPIDAREREEYEARLTAIEVGMRQMLEHSAREAEENPLPPELYARYEASFCYMEDPEWEEEIDEVSRLMDEHYRKGMPEIIFTDEEIAEFQREQESEQREGWKRRMVT